MYGFYPLECGAEAVGVAAPPLLGEESPMMSERIVHRREPASSYFENTQRISLPNVGVCP